MQLSALTLGLTASGCSVVGREINRSQRVETLEQATLPDGTNDRLWRVLNRAGYGPRPGEYQAAAELGFERWLEQQLEPEKIADRATDLMVGGFALYHSDLASMASFDPDDGLKELIWSSLSRQIYSKRQLYEMMVEFWSDHFAIFPRKDRRLIYLKIWDDREVIRPHALATFKDLVTASVYSPAMLHYLDNTRNFAEHPNENYARELLELHTLGVYGGYTQDDVMSVAGLLSGLTIRQNRSNAGQVYLNEGNHDASDQTILSTSYAGSDGEEAIAQLIDDLCSHPSTAQHISSKMVQRFVADDPPSELIDQVVQTYQQTDGDIKAMLRTIFHSVQFAHAPAKFKRPIQYVVSTCRALDVDVRPSRDLYSWFVQMGQVPFMWPRPDGYPDQAEAWVSNQLPRWNFAHDLVSGGIDGAALDFERLVGLNQEDPLQTIASLLYGETLNAQMLETFRQHMASGSNDNQRRRQEEVLSLMLASPDFQLI
ncbi:MAG: DUF1800 domain-containing protein [Chloroflexota bacterium]